MWWVLPLIGAGIGALGTGQSLRKQRDALKKQQEAAKKQYEYGKELSEKQWGIQRGEAEYQLGTQERALHEGMGQFADEYNTAMLARAFGEQDARIQNAANAGMSRVQEGMSGTRGSAAAELMRAYADAGLERNIDIQRQRDSQTLANTVAGANRAAGEIGRERDSWGAGGWRSESKAAQDEYNLNIYKLGQKEYEDAIWESDPRNFKANGWDYLTGAFSGASTGLRLGNSAYQFGQNGGFGRWSGKGRR